VIKNNAEIMQEALNLVKQYEKETGNYLDEKYSYNLILFTYLALKEQYQKQENNKND
jgi:hypothetical protein